ncbi:MAG: glycosyltransferase family 4 protein, partial [Saprospiraceae bacterium]|nr:glycosyltransferase family 4 protein [Saprospiraceae bacterium]
HLKLIQAATFTPKKGHLVTLEAFRQALADCPGLELCLVGEAHDKHCHQQVLQFIRAHRLGGQVRVLPPVDHRQMAGLLSGFDAFIHPSCHDAAGDHEATPVVTLEAQALGLPVLATRHFDLPDQVRHGQSGWLVEENDAGALAQAIRQFYAMPTADFSNMRRAARRCVEENFTVEHSAAALENIYRELV